MKRWALAVTSTDQMTLVNCLLLLPTITQQHVVRLGVSCRATTSESDWATFSAYSCGSWSADVAGGAEAVTFTVRTQDSTYWRDEIAASKGDMKKLWWSLSGVLGETSSDVTDDHSAADFAAFFTDKIDSVRASTSTTPLKVKLIIIMTVRAMTATRWSAYWLVSIRLSVLETVSSDVPRESFKSRSLYTKRRPLQLLQLLWLDYHFAISLAHFVI